MTTQSNNGQVSPKRTYLEPYMVKHLEQLLNSEEAYNNLLANLWRVRSGLHEVASNNPQVKEMTNSINEIMGCLLPLEPQRLQTISDQAKGIYPLKETILYANGNKYRVKLKPIDNLQEGADIITVEGKPYEVLEREKLNQITVTN